MINKHYNTCNQAKNKANQPKVIVPDKKSSVIIMAQSSSTETSLLPKTNIPPTGNPSVTIKKEIMASNTKLTEAEELAIAKKTAFASNLDSEHAFTNDLFNKKRTVHSKILQINQFSTAY
ncbi:hypothetical protein RclHR1_04360010 [Rhizophagus clarus]|uniref:Uncharacterized protein n=1 Tax=Rhizophagus clarus TaxID=94130 RepID=A0A2Z6RUA3_9GLOM|nr:hypothetical protein RclHR1_04360010 [Rhizophagus clarus]